jgi:hypothetical protein
VTVRLLQGSALDVAWITVVCCVGMFAADSFGTRLIQSVQERRGRKAGWCDVGSDFFGKVVLTGYGLTSLTHGHGLAGWACTVPVLATGYWTTKKTTEGAP